MTEKLQKGEDLDSHIRHYQEALQHLNTYGLNLPEKFAATFFVVSLYGNPHDPLSYHNFISNFKFSEATTLIATIADLRSFYRSSDLGQDAISSMPSIESALATVLESAHCAKGEHYCCNPLCPTPKGHLIKSCWAPGGGDYRPEGMGKSKKKKPKGKKGKEKAHVAEEGGSTSQPNISSTHFVANSMSHQYNSEFSAYSSVSESCSKPSPSVSDADRAYPAGTAQLLDRRLSLLIPVPPLIFTQSNPTSHISAPFLSMSLALGMDLGRLLIEVSQPLLLICHL
ncbi:hypothetical protein F5880DRAFT_1618121 [Lentinula raphanica]|nr:hypothetical protein F5880DRAFT_1618121 [Lentinula raphanica]